MMNINETLAEYYEVNNPIEDFIINEKILEFLCESKTPKKYKLSQQIIKNIVKQHGKDQLDSHITELYEVEKATMSLTGKRDHVIHALNTFLLGLYINNKYLDTEVDIFQWKLTALFHDIAYPLEISQRIIERYFHKLSAIKNKLQIENFDPVINLVPKNFEHLTNNKNALKYIQRRIYDWELDVNVQRRYADMIYYNKICHGILSALTVFNLVDLMYQKNNPQRIGQPLNVEGSDWNQKNFEQDIVSACSAIFVHNLPDSAFEKIDKNKAPLPYLLKLCDELQNWDRPNQNTLTGDSSENYDISIQRNKIIFKVKSKKNREKISKKIQCLNDSNISVENIAYFKNGTSE